MKKLTKREKFQMLLEVVEVQANPVLVEFINHELELLARKNSTGSLRKPTKTQQENEILLEEITDYFNNVATEPHTYASQSASYTTLTKKRSKIIWSSQ